GPPGQLTTAGGRGPVAAAAGFPGPPPVRRRGRRLVFSSVLPASKDGDPVSRLLSWMVRTAWSWARRRADIRHGSRAAARFASYGEGTSIAFPPATIFGEPWIEL